MRLRRWSVPSSANTSQSRECGSGWVDVADVVGAGDEQLLASCASATIAIRPEHTGSVFSVKMPPGRWGELFDYPPPVSSTLAAQRRQTSAVIRGGKRTGSASLVWLHASLRRSPKCAALRRRLLSAHSAGGGERCVTSLERSFDRAVDGLYAWIQTYHETTISAPLPATSKRTFHTSSKARKTASSNCCGPTTRRWSTDPQWRGASGHRLVVDQIARCRGLCRSHRVGARGHAELDPRTARAGTKHRPLQRDVLRELTDLLTELSDSAGFRHAELPQLTRPMAIILLGGLRSSPR